MVVDASALVAVFKREPRAPAIRTALAGASVLFMSSVTLTEILLIALKDGRVAELDIEIVPVDETLAVVAAEARHRFPIRFGDGFVYALARARGLPVLTLDAEFRKTDAQMVPLG